VGVAFHLVSAPSDSSPASQNGAFLILIPERTRYWVKKRENLLLMIPIPILFVFLAITAIPLPVLITRRPAGPFPFLYPLTLLWGFAPNASILPIPGSRSSPFTFPVSGLSFQSLWSIPWFSAPATMEQTNSHYQFVYKIPFIIYHGKLISFHFYHVSIQCYFVLSISFCRYFFAHWIRKQTFF